MTTIIWQDGFDYSSSEFVSLYGINNLVGSPVAGGRGGGSKLDGMARKATGLGTGAPFVTGAAFIPNANRVFLRAYNGSGAIIAVAFIDAMGVMEVSFPQSGGSIGPIDVAPQIRKWRYIEFQSVIAASGRAILAIDGSQICDVSLDTGTDAPAMIGVESTSPGGGEGGLDDWYFGTPGATPDFFGDYRVTGTPPATTGTVPSAPDIASTQQWGIIASDPPPADIGMTQQWLAMSNVAPKPDIATTQQWVIVAVKNPKRRNAPPQVMG